MENSQTVERKSLWLQSDLKPPQFFISACRKIIIVVAFAGGGVNFDSQLRS